MNTYKKKGEIHTIGECGRLNCLHTGWVLAGDTVKINWGGLFRMPNMRKYMWTPIDCRVFAFFTPAAWVYGPSFRTKLEEYMKNPLGSSADPFSSVSGGFTRQGSTYHWLTGSPVSSVPYSLAIVYNMIWNEWFRDINYSSPLQTSVGLQFTSNFQSGEFSHEYGRAVSNLPSFYNSINTNLDDKENYLDVSIAGSSVDLIDIQQQMQQAKDVAEYSTHAQRYYQMLGDQFGGSVSHEADPRPYLLGMKEMQFGGHDIDATGENIGETQGKSTGALSFNMDETYFGEHGFIQLFIVPRFNAIYNNSCNPLITMLNDGGYSDELIGHPSYISNQPVTTYPKSILFTNDGENTSFGKYPTGEYQRWGFNTVHRNFHDVESGFPLYETPDNATDMIYCKPEQWNNMFISDALGQYSVQSQYNITQKSVLPSSSSSIFTGAKGQS